MNRHYFVTPDAALQSRWREAFPDAVAIRDTPAAAPAASGIWISTRLAGWKTLLAACATQHAGVPVVVLDFQPDERTALQALDGGARGYCHALATPALLREIAIAVSHGGVWVGPELMSRMIGAAHRALSASAPRAETGTGPAPAPDALNTLSPREREVARAIGAGATNKEAAARLDITERTVKAHLSAVFEKLGVRDRLQLALLLAGENRSTPAAGA